MIKIISIKFKGGGNVLRNCIVDGFIEYGDNEMAEILENECSKVTDDMNGFRYICKFMATNQSIKYVVKYMEKSYIMLFDITEHVILCLQANDGSVETVVAVIGEKLVNGKDGSVTDLTYSNATWCIGEMNTTIFGIQRCSVHISLQN